MNKQSLYTNEFQKFIKDKITILNRPISEDWYGCFPIIKDNILVDIKLLLPKLKDKKTLLVNIHEYCHAMELYTELGFIYKEKIEEKENNARKLEKKFLEENTYDI